MYTHGEHIDIQRWLQIKGAKDSNRELRNLNRKENAMWKYNFITNSQYYNLISLSNMSEVTYTELEQKYYELWIHSCELALSLEL